MKGGGGGAIVHGAPLSQEQSLGWERDIQGHPPSDFGRFFDLEGEGGFVLGFFGLLPPTSV